MKRLGFIWWKGGQPTEWEYQLYNNPSAPRFKKSLKRVKSNKILDPKLII